MFLQGCVSDIVKIPKFSIFCMRKLTFIFYILSAVSLGIILGIIFGIAWMDMVSQELDGEYFRALKTMGGSGVNWIDAIFRYCVVLLVNIAKVLGISYEALNIWVFIIIQPIIILVLFFWVLALRKKIRIYKQID